MAITTAPARRVAKLALVTLSCALACSKPARANGRFPRAQQLVPQPGASQRLVLRNTFGLALSDDGGRSWGWVCEAAMHYRDEDPALIVSSDGAIRVAPYVGVAVSRDGGCNFMPVVELMSASIVDMSLVPDAPDQVLLLESTFLGDAAPVTRVWLSSNPASVEPLGSVLGVELLGYTLEAARGAPERIYVTAAAASGSGQGLLIRSDDAGESWTHLELPPRERPVLPFLSAVHPEDPDHVFVRVIHGSPQTYELIESRDAGASWRSLASSELEMRGFALAPGGNEWVLGLGLEPTLPVPDPDALGIFRSGIRVQEFPVHCLTWPDERLFACSTLEAAGFDVGVSLDAGTSFAPLFERTQLAPLACPDGAAAATLCRDEWPALCETLGAEGCHQPSGAAGAAGMAPRGDSGADGGGVPLGGSGAAGAPAQNSGGGSSQAGGCGCRLVGHNRGFFATAALVFLIASRFARKRRASRVPASRC